MGLRVELHRVLTATLGSSNVYYQPPESIKLKYPCIVYMLSGESDRHANNRPYSRFKRYNLIYITKDADDPMVDILDDLQYCTMDRMYVSDNLYHFAYSIFY